MAAVIGDFVSDHTRFHNIITGPGLHERSHSKSYHAPPDSRNRLRDTPSQNPRYSSSPVPSKRSWESAEAGEAQHDDVSFSSGGASRFPTPPDSASPHPSSTRIGPEDASSPLNNSMATATATETAASVVATSSSTPAPAPQAPSPVSDSYSSSANASTPQPGQTIVVRDLAHIQSLARAEMGNSANGPGLLNDPPLQATKYEISSMPISDIIEMVAALLTKITTTNDLQHDAMNRNVTHQQTAANHNNEGALMTPLSSSVLAFHGKNVPAITILSYLSRIHKYCPTTFEVFLSLLVYFDRMTERVNNLVVQAEDARRQSQSQPAAAPTASPSEEKSREEAHDDSDAADKDLIDDDDDNETGKDDKAPSNSSETASSTSSSPATYFVVDSFNIHRLIIAGVTCASKFFSDVFYTNSRYAKVGGLPLAELNHLELQFLLLNDFRLSVAVEDLEAYATMLVEFYAREVVLQRSQPAATSTE